MILICVQQYTSAMLFVYYCWTKNFHKHVIFATFAVGVPLDSYCENIICKIIIATLSVCVCVHQPNGHYFANTLQWCICKYLSLKITRFTLLQYMYNCKVKQTYYYLFNFLCRGMPSTMFCQTSLAICLTRRSPHPRRRSEAL